MADYVINPVLMGGLVKEVTGETVKIHLRGRLGVITVARRLILAERTISVGDELRFYFSYLEVDDSPREYDLTELCAAAELAPVHAGGTLTEVNDTAVRCTMPDGCGDAAVPRRWVITNVPLRIGETAGFWFSKPELAGKRGSPD